jgi:hypothetical protein
VDERLAAGAEAGGRGVTLVAAGPALVAVHLLAACIWVGGFVAIAIVAQIVRRTLDTPARIAFFRSLGRAYGIVGGASLLVALGTGAALLSGSFSTAGGIAALVAGAALLAVTAAGVRQARAMTRLRTRALSDPAVAVTLRRATLAATVLRTAIGLLTLALVGIGAVLAT